MHTAVLFRMRLRAGETTYVARRTAGGQAAVRGAAMRQGCLWQVLKVFVPRHPAPARHEELVQAA